MKEIWESFALIKCIKCRKMLISLQCNIKEEFIHKSMLIKILSMLKWFRKVLKLREEKLIEKQVTEDKINPFLIKLKLK